MIILHVIESLNPSGGGLPAAVKSLAREQVLKGHDVYILSCFSRLRYDCIDDIKSLNTLYLDDYMGSNSFNFFAKKQIWRKVFEAVKPNVCHLHGIWTPSFINASDVLHKLGIPNIVTVHGQLMPSLLQADNLSKKIKKFLYFKIFAFRIIKKANLVHAVCQAEADVLAKITCSKKIRIIYNFIEESFFKKDIENLIFSKSTVKVITFIGRIEKRKGIVNLVEAFCKSQLTEQWELRIVGPVYEGDLAKWIEGKARDSVPNKKIRIMGPVFGMDREKVYLDSFVVCLPSYSEVVGLVNIEAALLGKLVITTPYAGINEISNYGGIVCDNDIDSLQKTLVGLEKISKNEYSIRCSSLREWAQSTFDRNVLLNKWQDAIKYLNALSR